MQPDLKSAPPSSHPPTLESLSGDWQEMERVLSLPALSNGIGSVQCERNLTAFSFLNFPPIAQGGGNHDFPDWTGFSEANQSARLLLDGQPVETLHSRWSAFEVQRRANQSGLSLLSHTRLVYGEMGLLVEVHITNTGTATAQHELALELTCAMRAEVGAWGWKYPKPPGLTDFQGQWLEPGILHIQDNASSVKSAFALTPSPTQTALLSGGGQASWQISLEPGQSLKLELAFAVSMVGDEVKQVSGYQGKHRVWMEQARTGWETRWRAAFTPNNGHYSGHLPTLQADDPRIERVYYVSVLSLLALERRLHPDYPIVFVTCSPRNAVSVSYFWDTSMYATLWALLDPVGMKDQIRLFLSLDLQDAYAVDFVHLRGADRWYAANESSLFEVVESYLRVTEDYDFLEETLQGRTLLEHLEALSVFWETLEGGDGLADYKTALHLLECVPTYIHKVPAFNAANVHMMRTVAALLEGKHPQRAAELRAKSLMLAETVKTLYIEGKGYWACKQPDGRLIEVRHVLDFFYVILGMGEDLSPTATSEMVSFVELELLHDPWMRALSLQDHAAADSDRSDHGPMGAYDGWPAFTMAAFLTLGESQKASNFLKRVEAVTHEGPFGQAHRLVGPNGVSKAEDSDEYFNSCCGAFANVLLRYFFGFTPSFSGEPLWRPKMPRGFEGRLSGVRWHRQLWALHCSNRGLDAQTAQ